MSSDRENLEFLRMETIQKPIDGQRAQLFTQFQAGIWDQAEYREKLDELLNPHQFPPSPSPSSHQSSPDWPETLSFGDN